MSNDPVHLERHDVPFAGATLAVWTCGPADAPALVVCHGGALDHSAFRELALRHATKLRVVLWDMPGHGQSPRLASSFTAAACAEAMTLVMDHLGAAGAVVLGFSFGGVVAQLAAKARPDLVERLIAYGCLSPHLGKPLVPRALVPALVAGRFGSMSWPAIRERFGELCCVTPEGQAAVRRDMAPVGKAGFMAMARANFTASDRATPFRIRGGVDLIAGALDSNGETIWSTFRAFEAAYPAIRKILVADAGHCAHLDQPEAFARAVDELIRTPRSPS